MPSPASAALARPSTSRPTEHNRSKDGSALPPWQEHIGDSRSTVQSQGPRFGRSKQLARRLRRRDRTKRPSVGRGERKPTKAQSTGALMAACG